MYENEIEIKTRDFWEKLHKSQRIMIRKDKHLQKFRTKNLKVH